jgi:hypothetical protein
MKYLAILFLIPLVISCSKDPILDEITYFEGTFRVDSIRRITRNLNLLYTDPAEITLIKHPKTDTISAFGEETVVEPGEDENILVFSQSLYDYSFVKKFTNSSLYCVDVSGDDYVAYWFPDLNKKRLTFWTLCGSGNYRTVMTVKKLSDDRFCWTYVDANDPGYSNTSSALNVAEYVYVTKL